MSEQESGQVSEQEKEAIKELIDSSNLSLIGDGTMIVKNTTIATTLNYIDKLQKENERYKKAIDNGEYTWKQKYEETFGYVKELIEEKERAISKLQKENQELKEENTILEGNKIGYKLAIQELKENQVKQDKVINLMAKKIKAQDPFASVLDIDEKIIIGNFYKKVKEEK